jgi:hypothetical protein
MAVLVPGKLVYLAHARTASRATRDALLTLPDAHASKATHHAKLDQVVGYDGELVVATIRNPYDTLVSWWLHFKDMEFLSFLQEYDHYPFLDGDPPDLFWHCTPTTHVLRWETLQEDFDKLLDGLDLPRLKLEIKGPTKRKTLPWHEYYDEATTAAANERFGHIADKWGYPRHSHP